MINKVLLDNGHGQETPGKRSPVWNDSSQLFEWEFTRDIVKRIAKLLDIEKIPYTILVPEDKDISLNMRCRRANAEKNCFLISIHANAGGGTGWEVFTSTGKTKSDIIANRMVDIFKKDFPEWKCRGHKEANYQIVKYTKCPAILTENFFMDTEKDCRFIMSEQGRQRIAELHVKLIKSVIKDSTL